MNRNMVLISKVCLVLVLVFACELQAQGKNVKFISPSISFMDANTDGGGINHEIAVLVYDDETQRFYIEWEKENGRKFRRLEIRMEAFNSIYIDIFEKTARNIDNLNVGYYKKRDWLKFGGSIYRDIKKDISILGNISVDTEYFDLKYQRGIKKWIIDGSFNWGKPIRDKIFTLWGLGLVPVYQVLIRYYSDGSGRQFRQFKLSLVTEWRKG